MICSVKLLTIETYCSHVNRHTPINETQRVQQFNCPLCLRTPSYQKVTRLKKHLETCLEERQQEDIDENNRNCDEVTLDVIYNVHTENSFHSDDYESDIDMDDLLASNSESSGDKMFMIILFTIHRTYKMILQMLCNL